MIASAESLMLQLTSVQPANALLLGGVVLITLGLSRVMTQVESLRQALGFLYLVALAVAGAFVLASQPSAPVPYGLFTSDALTRGASSVVLLGGLLLMLLGSDRVHTSRLAEFYGCVLLMLSGVIYAASANDLTSLFLGLELVSLPTTVLLSLTRSDDTGREATLKYFTLAAFASGIFLLGCSYLYGLSGSTWLPTIYESLAQKPSLVSRTALTLALCGLCFRVTAVPFHFYAPDVFSGASMQMAAGLSLIPKVAGFVGIFRLLGGETLLPALTSQVVPFLVIVACITMTLGNCLALAQTKLRRLFAYSSVAHSGYLLLAAAALVVVGGSPRIVLEYLSVYAAMTLGMFAVLAVLERESVGSRDDLSLVNGLYSRHPGLTIGGVICLLSLTGLPLTAGFWAKLQVFLATLAASRWELRVAAVIMAVNATIAAVYYLGLVYRMFQPTCEHHQPQRVPLALQCAMAVSTILTVVWFFVP